MAGRGVATFSEEECEDESRGQWYYRQLLGSANISGGPLFRLALPDRQDRTPDPVVAEPVAA